jgi:hypothetical protein
VVLLLDAVLSLSFDLVVTNATAATIKREKMPKKTTTKILRNTFAGSFLTCCPSGSRDVD